jgi:inorganic phosphate transporter, PiT family
MSVIVVAVVLTALLFDFTNGFHDTANAMATSIATGALRPRVAVVLAGVLNLIGAFLSVQVAKTISSGLVNETKITPVVIFGGLIGAILWNLLTWLFSLPSSSSHALFGGLIGASWVFAGSGAVNFATVVSKVLLPLVLSPIIAATVALTLTYLLYRITAHREQRGVTRFFRFAQIASASALALAHGTNDAQKTMGVITLTLITAGLLPTNANPPLWVIASCAVAIAAGTALGGWRIIQTLGRRISTIQSPQGFIAETTSTAVILTSTHLGFPLSTTQVATGSIFGAGAGTGQGTVHGAVRWDTAAKMALAWLFTLPAAAAIGALAASIAATGITGTTLVAALAATTALGIYALSRRRPVTADNVNELPAPAAVSTVAKQAA